jgi:hypothetical protein
MGIRMGSMTRRALIAVVTVAVGVWSLGTFAAAEVAAAKKVNVCKLLTQEQVATVVGNANDGPQDAGSFLGDGSCDYLGGGTGTDLRLVVTTNTKRDGRLNFATKARFDKTYGADEKVSGPGKVNLYHFDASSSVAQSAFMAVKGKKAVLVVLTGTVDHDTGFEKARQLATLVMKKL